jgi:calcium-binding protein KIC and related proteins
VDTADAPASRLHAGTREESAFEELLLVMRKQLGTTGLLAELRMGFRQLAHPARGSITSKNLQR